LASTGNTYRSISPWNTDRPQAEFKRLADTGEIKGKVLDIRCGTGENALYLAQRGFRVTGIDSEPTVIAKAMLEASARNLKVPFFAFDALHLGCLGMRFDTVIDSGLFQDFSNLEKKILVNSVAQALKMGGCYHLLCVSDLEKGELITNTVTQEEIRSIFREGWEIICIKEARLETTLDKGWYSAWLASIERI
jgi:2-polyprenyl-3-methyl-5-hydroxy-6-metoxy-1,4-benzoquinol methylase